MSWSARPRISAIIWQAVRLQLTLTGAVPWEFVILQSCISCETSRQHLNFQEPLLPKVYMIHSSLLYASARQAHHVQAFVAIESVAYEYVRRTSSTMCILTGLCRHAFMAFQVSGMSMSFHPPWGWLLLFNNMMIAILFYDYILSLLCELTFIWRRKFVIVTLLYITTRYTLIPLYVILCSVDIASIFILSVLYLWGSAWDRT